MHRKDRQANFNVRACAADALVTFASYGAAILATRAAGAGAPGARGVELLLPALFFVVYFLFMLSFRMYNVTTFHYLDRVVRATSLSFVYTALVFACLLWLYGSSFPRASFGAFVAIGLALLNLSKAIQVSLKGKSSGGARVIYVGGADVFGRVRYFADMSGFRFSLIGYVPLGAGGDYLGAPCLGEIADLEAIVKEHLPEQVLFAVPLGGEGAGAIAPWLQMLADMGIVSRVVFDFYAPKGARRFVSSFGTFPMLTHYNVAIDPVGLFLKRAFDIVGAAVGIVLAAPAMLAAAAAIKLDSPGPAIFRHERVGRNGKRFHMYKFRSMVVGAEGRQEELAALNEMDAKQRLFKIRDDPRVTRVGRFLRRTSIDELPQLFNVLKGDMSLVGIRPPTVDEVARYDSLVHWRRISIKPGVTGLWQTSGRNSVKSFEEVVKMDIVYIENWSILLDVSLILKTFVVLFNFKGAY
jgi:exopolysaccharide biosynthesis polyprenyl glycosylphosphotransferase